jgi:hypothetical protein
VFIIPANKNISEQQESEIHTLKSSLTTILTTRSSLEISRNLSLVNLLGFLVFSGDNGIDAATLQALTVPVAVILGSPH